MGRYAVFEPSLRSFEAEDDVRGERPGESGYVRRPGPAIGRYGPEFDPEEPDARFEHVLPVDGLRCSRTASVGNSTAFGAGGVAAESRRRRTAYATPKPTR